MQINIPTDRLLEVKLKIIERVKKTKELPNWITYTLIASILIIAITLTIIFWPRPPQPIYPTVEVQPVIIDNVEIYGEYTGKIKAQQHVEVRARVEGYLEHMHFAEGGYVKKK